MAGRPNGTPMIHCGMGRGVSQGVTVALLAGYHGSVEHYLVRLQTTLRSDDVVMTHHPAKRLLHNYWRSTSSNNCYNS